jgi:ACR3 family arsenite transporter
MPRLARAFARRNHAELLPGWLYKVNATGSETAHPPLDRGTGQLSVDLRADPAAIVRRLSTLDRFLPLWIFSAMAIGLLLGRLFPGLGAALDRVQVAGVSVPIAIGLLWMMYPVLAKVRYETIGGHISDRRLLGTSLVLNWVLGPLVMFALAWIFLPDLPEYRNGLILIGLARCIAMVLIWNTLACGSGELAAVLVALNSVFQIIMYSFLGWLFLTAVPGWFGAETAVVDVSMWAIAKSVMIFLGVPLLAGYLTRRILVRRRGRDWYDDTFMPRFGPTALIGLLYTIVLMFAMQGDRILQLPLDVMRIALPLLVYFFVMFGVAFVLSRKLGFGYQETAALSFTAAGNNFELAIAVAVATFGIASGEALAAVVGPLIEVPALIGLVYVSLWAGRRYFHFTPAAAAVTAEAAVAHAAVAHAAVAHAAVSAGSVR